MTRVNITNNTALIAGGGIEVIGAKWDESKLSVDWCNFHSNIANATASSKFGGAALHASKQFTIFIRQSAFVNNYATNGQGHLVFTDKDDNSPITFINTKISLCEQCGSGAFWSVLNDQYTVHIPMSSCSQSPCNVAPFTGTCVDRTANYGVICKFSSSKCAAGSSSDFSEEALPPSVTPECKACDPGTYSSSGSVRCSVCPHGEWQNLTGASICNKCDPGKYLFDPGTSWSLHQDESQCLLCMPGRSSRVRGAAECPNVCQDDHYQHEAGQTECNKCPSGQFTRKVHTDDATEYHNNVTDCHLLPRGTRVLPSTSRTEGNQAVSIYGHNFFNGKDIKVESHGNAWLTPIVHNKTWITAIVPPGVGAAHPVSITIDGLASIESSANFSYLPPNISSLHSPPFQGGSIQIFGGNFGNIITAISIVVDNRDCTRYCTGPEVFDDHLLCQYNEIGTSGCRGVTVTVGGQSSNLVEFCYSNINKGEMTGVPVGVQDVIESKSKSYEIGLSLTPADTVKINISATPSSPSFSCAVLPTTLVFTTNSTVPQPVIVTTVGNFIDEGADATVYNCSVVHTVASGDPQYSNSPSRKVTIRVVNDDVADINLWTVDPKDGSFDYGAKFIGPLCHPEGGNVSYGIRLDTEPRATVKVSINVDLQKKDRFSFPPILYALPREGIVFTPADWNKTQLLILHSLQDDIAHDTARFKVTHTIETTDTVITKRATAFPMVVVVDATDDDDAGIDMLSPDTAIALTEGGPSVTVTLAKLRSRPNADVNVSVLVPSEFIVPGRREVFIPRADWDRVDQDISLSALVGAPSDSMQHVILQPRSADRKYNVAVAVRLKIVLTPLERRLIIPQMATVTEGSKYSYAAKLSIPLAAGSMVALSINASDGCRINHERRIMFTSVNATNDVLISVVADDNFVDEGGPVRDVISFVCNVVHVLKNIGGAPEYNNQRTELKLSVQNNDHADLNVQAYSPNSRVNNDKLKVLGPLCLEEGKNVTYGVVLTSQPSSGVVRVKLSVATTRMPSPLILRVFPPVVTFDATNWDVPYLVIVLSSRDFVDNDLTVEDIRVFHDVETEDRIFRLTATRAVTNLQVTDHDHDVAGLDVEPRNGILEVPRGLSKTVRLLRFRTRPIHKVNITARLVNAPPGLAFITPLSQQEFHTLGNWTHVMIPFTVHARKWNSYIHEGTMEFVVSCSSEDSNYDSLEKRLELNIIDMPFDTRSPGKPTRKRVINSPFTLAVSWSYLNQDSLDNLYEVEWNQGDDTFSSFSNSFKTASQNIVLNAPLPLSSRVVYVRVRLATSRPGPWSSVSDGWNNAKKCDFVGQYLNTSNSLDSWRCMECPLGASCVGEDVTWKEVKALFGWWRNAIWTEDAASKFTMCSFPPACLGAKNKYFENTFVLPDDEVDYAMVDNNETCNSDIGYAVTCGRNNRCRLCGTCKEGYQRRVTGGTARCDKCPDSGTNKVFLGVGTLLVFSLLGLLIIQHIKKGGMRTLTGMQKMTVINYFQLTYMIANMDVPWPDAMRILFDVEGAVSTIGEQLINPACELTHVPVATIIFHKQIAYLLLLPVLIMFTKTFWRLHAWWQGRPFRYRGENLRSPSHKDGSVATIVFLIYLVYPTLCRQAFALLVCNEIDGTWYMKMDLEEQCFVGRHFTYFVCCTLPQILLHVFGVPLLGLWAAWRGFRGNNKKMLQSISMFRYGMLYSAYSKKRWYWGIVISSRKAIIAFLTSLINDPALEVHWLILYLALQILGNMIGQQHIGIVQIPDKDAQFLQFFDSLTLFLLLITSWSGLFFNLSPTCGGRQYGCLAMMVFITILNAGFFFYCLYLFRTYIAAQARYICCYVCRKWAKKKTKGGLRRTKKRSSTHANPLAYRRSMVEGKTTVNPFASSRRLCMNLKSVEIMEISRTKKKPVGHLNATKREAQSMRFQRIKKIKSARDLTVRPNLSDNKPQSGKRSDWFKVVDTENPGSCNRQTNEVRRDLSCFPSNMPEEAEKETIDNKHIDVVIHENPMRG